MDAFAKGDAEAVGALYTNDCKVMPTGSDVIEGQQGSYMYMYNLLFYLPGKAHYIHTLNFILLCGGWTMCVIIGTRMILVGFSSYLIFSLSIGAAKVFRSVMREATTASTRRMVQSLIRESTCKHTKICVSEWEFIVPEPPTGTML